MTRHYHTLMKRILERMALGLLAPMLLSSAALAQTSSAPEPNQVLPRFTRPDAPALTQTQPDATITPQQAPLPLGTVYTTPIEQFEPPFADVSVDHWAYEAVTRLYYSGIVSGFPANP